MLKEEDARGSDGKLNFSENDRGKVWKEHMERIMMTRIHGIRT